MESRYNKDEFNIEIALQKLSSSTLPFEKILKIITGFYNSSKGLFVATSERLIFISGNSSGISLDLPYDKIFNISLHTTEKDRGNIILETKNTEITISHCESQVGDDFVSAVESFINNNLNFIGL